MNCRKRNGTVSLFLLSCVVAALLLVVGVGCERKTVAFIVGTIGHCSGDNAAWCEIQRNGFALAADEINTTGGIKGAPLILRDEDSRGDSKTAVSAFNKLVDEDGVRLVIGSLESDTTLALAPIANSKNVVLLSTGSIAAGMGNAGPYIFSVMPSDEVQASMTAEWMFSRGYRQTAVLYVDNSWGRGLMDTFVPAFKKLGGEVVSIQGSDPGAKDFRAQLSKIRALNPAAIYAPLSADNAGVMLGQAKELGIRTQVFGADVYANPVLVKAAGNAAEGVLLTRYGSHQGKEFQDFAEKYKKRFGKEPVMFAAYCYDAVRIAARTLGDCDGNGRSGDVVRKALLGLSDYRGASGLTSFRGGNSASGRTIEKLIIRGGRFLPVD